MELVKAKPIVFVTRKFPPSVGGMENLAKNTWEAISAADRNAKLIALGSANANLAWWLPLTAVRLLVLCAFRRHRAILFGDAFTSAMLSWIPGLFRTPAVTVVHGLDITYRNFFYRHFVIPRLRRTSLVLTNSSATRETAVAGGVDRDRVRVITLGVPEPPLPHASHGEARRRLLTQCQLDDDARLVVTTGRLTRRKGVLWFTENVTPQLPSSVHHLIIGDGKDRDAILESAKRHGLQGRVHLLGQISNNERDNILHGADLYVQPNISVPGDMEGFGLVVTEASQAGLLTLAAKIEGLSEAVEHEVTGIHVPSGDAAAWVNAIRTALDDPDRAQRAEQFAAAARTRYSVTEMGRQLVAALESIPTKIPSTAAAWPAAASLEVPPGPSAPAASPTPPASAAPPVPTVARQVPTPKEQW